MRSHHYAACQSIRLDRSRNGPKNAQSANPNNGYGHSNIPCATEAPSAIRAPTGGAIPGRNRGGRRVSVSGSNAEPRGRCAGATAARAGFRRRRLTTLNEQAELPVLEWIAVSGLILVHRGPRLQGPRRSPCARASLSLLPFDADDDAPPGSLHTVGVAFLAAGVGRVRHRDVALRAR